MEMNTLSLDDIITFFSNFCQHKVDNEKTSEEVVIRLPINSSQDVDNLIKKKKSTGYLLHLILG